MKYTVFIVLSHIIRDFICPFSEAHLDIKKFKVFLCTSFDHKNNPSVRQFGYQDTTSRLTHYMPGNGCVQAENIW